MGRYIECGDDIVYKYGLGSQASDLHLICEVYSIGSFKYEGGYDLVKLSADDLPALRKLLSVDDETTARPGFIQMLEAVLEYADYHPAKQYLFESENYRLSQDEMEELRGLAEAHAGTGPRTMGAGLKALFDGVKTNLLKAKGDNGGTTTLSHNLTLSACTITDQELQARVTRLAFMGFLDAGSFTVKEMPGVRLQFLANERDDITAVVYRHPTQGVWSDVLIPYQTGGYVLVANTHLPARLNDQPGVTKIYLPKADESELVARVVAEAGSTPRRAVPRQALPSFFQETYREAMEWLAGRGGASENEIRRFAEADGRDLSDLEILLARTSLKAGSDLALQDAIHATFQRTLSQEEWRWAKEHSVIIHDHTTCADATLSILALLDTADVSHLVVKKIEKALNAAQQSPVDCIHVANALLPQEIRLQGLTAPNAPANARLFVLPAMQKHG